jgi:hypothetical protein
MVFVGDGCEVALMMQAWVWQKTRAVFLAVPSACNDLRLTMRDPGS